MNGRSYHMTKGNFIIIMISLLLLSACSPKLEKRTRYLMTDTPQNIMIASSPAFGMGPCEPSICIDPSNPDHIVAGSILNRVHVSQDGGMTWDNTFLSSSLGVFGDPVVRISNSGKVHYAHLSNPSGKAYESEDFLDRIVVQTSYDGGKTFNDGNAPSNDRTKDQDKQWLYIDPVDETILMSWTEFDKYNSYEPEDKSRILFSKSLDHGESWMVPVDISDNDGNCLDDDLTTEGAVPVMDADGNIYVAWAYMDKIYFDKSTDGGNTWLPEDKIVTDQFGGWAFDIPGISRCNGMPILGIDRSGSEGKGNLYINWSDQKSGPNDTDIWLVRSTDGGQTWSKRIKVNDDKSARHQFFSWMDVDRATGYIYIVFYDRRAYADDQTDVFLAYSTDQGNTFTNVKISESPFTPKKEIFFGDYNDISAFNGRVRPIWTRFQDNKLSVWTALIDFIDK